MTWQEIRELHPNRWVVIEALDAHTDGSERILDRLILIAPFADDYLPAWKHFLTLHDAAPEREYYVLHTDREKLDIGVIDAFGRHL